MKIVVSDREFVEDSSDVELKHTAKGKRLYLERRTPFLEVVLSESCPTLFSNCQVKKSPDCLLFGIFEGSA